MKKPFFAKFLENQVTEKENRKVKGGVSPVLTNKFADLDQTMKFPSDNDEGDHTMKYPSDGDEDNTQLM